MIIDDSPLAVLEFGKTFASQLAEITQEPGLISLEQVKL
jgi:hypothetical protein